MTVGSKVFLRSTDLPSMYLSGRMPEIGTVVEDLGASSRVVWPRSGVETATVLDASLQEIFSIEGDADGGQLVADIGKYVQLFAWPDFAAAQALITAGVAYGPRSPAASGVLIAAYGVGDVDGEAPEQFVCIIAVQDGRGEHVIGCVIDTANFQKPYIVQDRTEVGYD